MQYVYLPTAYEANFNENIKAAVANRTAIAHHKSKSLFTPNAKYNVAAASQLLTPTETIIQEVVPEVLSPNAVANESLSTSLFLNKRTRRQKRRQLLEQIEAARAARKTQKRKTRKELLEEIKIKREAVAKKL